MSEKEKEKYGYHINLRFWTGAEGRTSLSGVAGFEVGVSASDKVWRMFTAAGDIAFACSYAQVFIDIQVSS